MDQVQIGIIGGSGLYDMSEVTDRREVTLQTPFGDPSGPFLLGTLRGRRVAFLARHGAGHRLLPSELNFRANIFGMKMLGVEYILSASAVGSLREEFKPRDLVIPDDPTVLSYLLSGIVQIELPRRQALLEASTTVERLEALVKLLDREVMLLANRLRLFAPDPRLLRGPRRS